MIGYYAHHQGRGHLHRALCITGQLSGPSTILTSATAGADDVGGRVRLVALARDDDAPADDPTAGGTLHWAPLHHPGLRARMATVAAWIAEHAPAVMVVDVSVEIAALCRLMGVPVVVVAMQGDRDDRAHRLAYDLAEALLACWPATVAMPQWPAAWSDKTCFASAFSRFDTRIDGSGPPARAGRRRVALLSGAGGSDISAADVAGAIRATPAWEWDVLGGPAGRWVADPWAALRAADVVITHAGQNALAEVAASRTPAVVIPQDRPHGEQRATAERLRQAGLATVLDRWPAPTDWPALLDAAGATDGRGWAAWCPGDGADRAARFIESVAARTAGSAVSCAPR